MYKIASSAKARIEVWVKRSRYGHLDGSGSLQGWISLLPVPFLQRSLLACLAVACTHFPISCEPPPCGSSGVTQDPGGQQAPSSGRALFSQAFGSGLLAWGGQRIS